MRKPWRTTSRPAEPSWPEAGPADVLELWPDYGHGPLWSRRQKEYVRATDLPLPAELARRLTDWGERYEEDRLPLDGAGDPAYLAEGARLLAEVRAALGPQYRVVVTEPWWGEPPEDEPTQERLRPAYLVSARRRRPAGSRRRCPSR